MPTPQSPIQQTTNPQTSSLQNTTVSSINNQSYADIVKSVTSEIRKEIQKINNSYSPIEETVKNLYNSMLTPEIKDSHFIEIERLIEKKQNFSTRETVLKCYHSNKIAPGSLDKKYFPTPMYLHDKSYLEKFNKMIEGFQMQITEFNLDYIKDKVEELDDKISDKLRLISTYDKDAKTKAENFEKLMSEKYKPEIASKIEKVNRIVNPEKSTNRPNQPNNNNNQNQNQNQTNQSQKTHYNNSNRHMFRQDNRNYNNNRNFTSRNNNIPKKHINYSNSHKNHSFTNPDNHNNHNHNNRNNHSYNYSNNRYNNSNHNPNSHNIYPNNNRTSNSYNNNHNTHRNNQTFDYNRLSFPKQVNFQNQASFTNHRPQNQNIPPLMPRN